MAKLTDMQQLLQQLPIEIAHYILNLVEQDNRKLALQLSMRPPTTTISLEKEAWMCISKLVSCDNFFFQRACRVRDALYCFGERQLHSDIWFDEFEDFEQFLLEFFRGSQQHRVQHLLLEAVIPDRQAVAGQAV